MLLDHFEAEVKKEIRGGHTGAEFRPVGEELSAISPAALAAWKLRGLKMATMASRPNTVFTNYDVACSLIGPGRERITQVQRILESLEDSACRVVRAVCEFTGSRQNLCWPLSTQSVSQFPYPRVARLPQPPSRIECVTWSQPRMGYSNGIPDRWETLELGSRGSNVNSAASQLCLT